MTIWDEGEKQSSHERARVVRVGEAEVMGSCIEQGPFMPAHRTSVPSRPIVKRCHRELNPSGPVRTIYYRNGGEKLTRAQESRRGGEGHKEDQVDMQSSERDIEPSETPVLQLRHLTLSDIAEGKEGRGARRIKHTAKFKSLDKASL